MNGFLGILLVALLAGALIYAAALGERKRREALAAVARRLGLDFDARGDRSIHRVFRHPVFGRGRSRQSSNHIFGVLNISGYPVEVRMADYQYVTGSGKSRHTHHISFACFRLPFTGIPDLLIRREHLGDKLLGGLGFDDIDFESEEFSRRFFVQGGDRRWAYGLIHPGMMEFLLKGPTPQVEIVDDWCLVLEGSGRWDPGTFEGTPGWFEAFLQRWPDHLIEQLPPRPGRPA